MHDDCPLNKDDCPSTEDFHRFLKEHRSLDPREVEHLESRVEECESCRARLHAVNSSLRVSPRAAESGPDWISAEDREFVARLKERRNKPGIRRSLEDGQHLGPYRIVELLGIGGMGEVYKAWHERLERFVALKVLSADRLDDPQIRRRFRREMKLIGRLAHPHPNIVAATHADEIDGVPFLVMEYVNGKDIARLVKERGPLEIADACEIIKQAATGLAHVHREGVAHRDIKPSNLLLTRDGVVKVLDLGLAKLWGDHHQDSEDLTPDLQIVGSPPFVAPEQVSDAYPVTHRADLYGLGCTLYYVLAGYPPFHGPEYPSDRSKALAHVQRPVPPIRGLRPEVPEGLAAILDRMLAKNPAERHESTAELAAALEPFARGSCLAGLVDETVGSSSLPPAIPEDRAPVAAGSRPDTGPVDRPQDKPSPSSPPKRRGFWAVAPVAAMLCLGGAWAAWQAVVVRNDRGKVPLKPGDVVTIQPALTKPVHVRSEAPPATKKQGPGPQVASASPRDTRPAAPPPAPPNPMAPAPLDPPKLTPPPIRVELGEPMSEYALVTRPAEIRAENSPRVLSWTIATREISGGHPVQAFQPGGGVIAVGDDAGTIRLFDGKTDRLRRVMITGADAVRALAWSPDGRLLASSGYLDPGKKESGSVVRVWDAERGSLLRFARRPGKALALDWSPNGRLLASHGGGLWLWDIYDDWSKRLCDSSFGVSAWAADGTRLAVRGEDAIGIHAIDPVRGLREIPLKGERPALLAWSPDGKTLASVSENANMLVGLFDPNTGRQIRTITPETSGTQSMRSSALLWKADSASFVTVTPATVQLWDAESGGLKQTLHRFPSTGPPFDAKLALATDGGIALATIGGVERSQFTVWDVMALKPRYAIACYDNTYETKWSPHGLGATQINWKIRLVSTSSTTFPDPPEDAELPHDSEHEASWSPTRNLLAYCDRHDRFVILDGDTGLTRYLEAKAPMVIAWSPDGTSIASASSGPSALTNFATQYSVTISDVSSGRVARTLDGTFRKPILAWSPDGKRLAVVSPSGSANEKDSIRAFETTTGRCVLRLSDNTRQDPSQLFSGVSGPAWSPDGSAIATAVGKWMQICDANTGLLIKEYDGPNVFGGLSGLRLRWSEDGQSIKLLGMREGKGVFVERERTGRTLHDTSLAASGNAFFPDDRVVSGDRPLLRLCETSKGQTILTIVLFEDGRSVNISPEGHFAGRPGVEQRLVYVVLTEAGQETWTPEEFRTRFHWRNDEGRALYQPKAPAPPAGKGPIERESANGPRASENKAVVRDDPEGIVERMLAFGARVQEDLRQVQGKWKGANVDNGESWDVVINGNEITAKIESTDPNTPHYLIYKKGRFSVGGSGTPRPFDLDEWSTWDGTQYRGDAFHKFDLRLMSWGDGSGVPTSGNNLIIVGPDNNGLLHDRIFDAGGIRVAETDQTLLPPGQAGAISALKQQLPDLLPPHVLTGAEKGRIINDVTSIFGQTPFHKAIYRLSGDTLTLRVGDAGQPRPTEFRGESPTRPEPARAYYPVQIQLKAVRDEGR